jgi:hypothetical protein
LTRSERGSDLRDRFGMTRDAIGSSVTDRNFSYDIFVGRLLMRAEMAAR